MEANPRIQPEPSSGPKAVKRMRFYYLNSEASNRLDSILDEFTSGNATEDLLSSLKGILPIEKWNDRSLRQHVEGMFYLSERLWTTALETGKKTWDEKFSRENLLRITKTMPMSHYSYLVGSREPANVLLTRDDALQDPPTAMVKLTHDIESLADFIQNPKSEA